MAYYISKTVDQPFAAVIAELTTRIPGTCNPRFAHEALKVVQPTAEEVRRLLAEAIAQVGT